MQGGHRTESGHRIGMTNDQMTAFMDLRVKAIRDILTDSAFTPEQKSQLVKEMPSMEDAGFYQFLNTQFRTGPDLAEYIRQFVSSDRPRHGPGPKGTKKKIGGNTLKNNFGGE